MLKPKVKMSVNVYDDSFFLISAYPMSNDLFQDLYKLNAYSGINYHPEPEGRSYGLYESKMYAAKDVAEEIKSILLNHFKEAEITIDIRSAYL